MAILGIRIQRRRVAAAIIHRILGASVLLLLSSGAARGQSAASSALAKTEVLKCSFTTMATGTWKSGEPVADVKPVTLAMEFTDINADEGTAHASGRGTLGASQIIVRFVGSTLHFVQMFLAGPLYTTTIFSDESRDGKFKAVHTRHEYTIVSILGFTSRPEQYYGECEIVSDP